eukprot:TCALIF_04214-PA protein Name:"Similar to SLC4A2 Anion exchange protein 2 (Cavia porcellus)" AED:0.09 eAED:0.09 QI:384/0.70/0.66/0.88/0.88/0.83/18/317/1415
MDWVRRKKGSSGPDSASESNLQSRSEVKHVDPGPHSQALAKKEIGWGLFSRIDREEDVQEYFEWAAFNLNERYEVRDLLTGGHESGDQLRDRDGSDWSRSNCDANADLDRECDKIFHPDKFDIAQLNPDSQGNVDERARQYRTATAPTDLQAMGAGALVTMAATLATEGGAELSHEPFFQRSSSFVEPPVTDSGLQRSKTATGMQARVMGQEAAHDRQAYPHFHQVMSRLKTGQLKRAETDQAIRTTKKDRRPLETVSEERKRLKKYSDVKTLPTIQDDEGLRGDFEMQPTSTEKVESSGSDNEEKKTKAQFSIAMESSDEEGQGHRQIKRTKSKDFAHRSDDESWGFGMDKKVSFGGPGQSSHNEESHVDDDEEDREEKRRKRHKKSRRGSRHMSIETDLSLRRTRGSELQMEDMALPTEEEEARNLEYRDVEDMASHRMDHLPGYSRHKIKKGASTFQVKGTPETYEQSKEINQMVEKLYGEKAKVGCTVQQVYDHSPHDLFVEMDELQGEEWIEMARWIKYEEDREEGAERWGKAHVSSLSFHSLINLRLALEGCAFILDLEARDIPAVAYRVVEEWSVLGDIEEDQKGDIIRVLTYRHKYVTDHATFKFGAMKKNMSQRSLQNLGSDSEAARSDDGEAMVNPLRWFRSFSRDSFARQDSSAMYLRQIAKQESALKSVKERESLLTDQNKSNVQISKAKTFIAPDNGLDASSGKDLDHLVLNIPEDGEIPSNSSAGDLYRMAQSKKEHILRKIKVGTEGTIVLVGSLESVTKPISALVRLAEGIIMPNALEVPLPVRFIFILLTPKPSKDMDCHEIGRSFSTLMSNPKFHTVCYKIDERRELLSAINDFLDESVVLPPGDWDSNNLLSINEIKEMRKRRQNRKKVLEMKSAEKAPIITPGDGDGDDGDDDDDKKKKTPFNDPLVRTKTPFGGVINDWKRRFPWYLSDFKDGLNTQCLAATIFIYFACLSGAIAFGGLTADKSKGLIGIPETLIMSAVGGLMFALFAGQPLIITGVTGPVLLYDEALFGFATNGGIDFLAWRVWIGVWIVIIALVVALFQGSTLVKFFTKFTKDIFASLVSLLFIFEALKKVVLIFGNHPLMSLDTYCAEHAGGNITALENEENVQVIKKEPNTALLSAILMFGTFFIAYFLRVFRNGKYLGRTIRRALGDFGVPIAIVIMVAMDYFIDDTFTQKLDVPAGVQVTSPERRGWLIPPLGLEEAIPVWAPFVAVVPAILLYLLLFMETHICEQLVVIYHEIVSQDQRVSGTVVSILLGFSVLLSPALKLVPFAVLFGVFLYMGVSSINGIQLFDRITLLLMPVKHHPQVSYVRRVKTWKMHLYTVLQVLGLAVLWVVKSTQLALAFPFFVVAMIPYRMSLKYLFSPRELDALDGPKAGQVMLEDEPDFYDQAYGA